MEGAMHASDSARTKTDRQSGRGQIQSDDKCKNRGKCFHRRISKAIKFVCHFVTVLLVFVKPLFPKTDVFLRHRIHSGVLYKSGYYFYIKPEF